MGTVIPYLVGDVQTVSPDAPNLIWRTFSGKMETLLGGRTPIIAQGPSGNFPASLLGKPYFANEGLTPYSNRISLSVPLTRMVPDTLASTTVTVTVARPYDHSYFVAAAARPVISWDDANHLAHIADVPQSAYPPGVTKQNGISIFEHSIATHTVQHVPTGKTDPETYYIQEDTTAAGEGGGTSPTRKNRYSVAELILEGLTTTADFSVCAYPRVRANNLSSTPATFVIGTSTFTLTGFECQAYVRNADGSYAKSAFRYFWEFAGNDPRCFWFHSSLPSFVNNPTLTPYSYTKAGSMQANNVINFALLYDWIQFLTSKNNYAWFLRDPHELCDMGATYATKFAQDSLGGLLHHNGELKIARISRTLTDDLGYPVVVFDSVQFKGYATIVADFAAKLITVAENGSGVYTLTNADPDNDVDLIGVGTNLLKKNSYAGDFAEHQLVTAIALNNVTTHASTPYTLENAVLEHGASKDGFGGTVLGSTGQDVDGVFDFVLRTSSNYRITQRDITAAANTKQYLAPSGVLTTVTSGTISTMAERALVVAKVIGDIHKITLAELKSLSIYGDSSLPNQNVNVTFTGQKLTLTPEGWVLTFTEQMQADIFPDFAAALYTFSSYVNQFGTHYRFNPVTGKFEAKHAIRFRKHGFGYGQFGKTRAAFFPPFDGRQIHIDWINEVNGDAGADFVIPLNITSETGIKVLTQVGVDRLGTAKGGGFMLKIGANMKLTGDVVCNLDGLVAFDLLARQEDWYWQNRQSLIEGGPDAQSQAGGPTARHLLAMRLSVEHYNGFTQAVNQLKTGHPLDWKCLQFVYSGQVLSLAFDDTNSTGGVVHWRNVFGTTTPAPMTAFCGISGTFKPYWLAFLGSHGVHISGTADLPPSWNTYRNAFNEDRTISRTVTGTISGAGYTEGDYITIQESGGNSWHALIRGTVAWNMSAFTVGPAVNSQQGFATIYSPGGLDVLKQLSDYSASSWISAPDFGTFCAGLGFPFKVSDGCITLLTLRQLEIQPVLNQSTPASNNLSASYTGVLSGVDTGSASGSLPPTFANSSALRAMVAATTGSFTDTFSFATWRTKQIAFTVPKSTGEAEWKIYNAPTKPTLAFKKANRTAGKIRTGIYRHPSVQVLSYRSQGIAPGFPKVFLAFDAPRMFTDNNGRAATFTGSVYPYGTVPPWYGATLAQFSPVALGLVDPLRGPGAPPYTISGEPDFLVVSDPSGPRLYTEWAIPTDATQLDSQDRYGAALNAEQNVMGCYIYSAQADLTQDFYLAPVQEWAAVKDWWLADLDSYLEATLQVHDTALLNNAGTVSGLFLDSPQGTPVPPRSVAPGAASIVTAGLGVTLIPPPAEGAWRVLWEPTEALIAL